MRGKKLLPHVSQRRMVLAACLRASGMPVDEIAVRIGVERGQAYRLLNYARRHLQRLAGEPVD